MSLENKYRHILVERNESKANLTLATTSQFTKHSPILVLSLTLQKKYYCDPYFTEEKIEARGRKGPFQAYVTPLDPETQVS